MRVPCSPETFYRLTLAEQGFLPPAEEETIAKIAEARSCSVEVVKLAQVYFEQLQKDGVPYESPAIMTSDAFKMAEAFLEHKVACEMEAAKFMEDLVTKLAAVAAAAAEEAGVGELSPMALLKIAGLQAQENLDLVTKIAMVETVKEAAAPAAPPGAPPTAPPTAPPAFDATQYHDNFKNLNTPVLARSFVQHLSGNMEPSQSLIEEHVRQMKNGLHPSRSEERRVGKECTG